MLADNNVSEDEIKHSIKYFLGNLENLARPSFLGRYRFRPIFKRRIDYPPTKIDTVIQYSTLVLYGVTSKHDSLTPFAGVISQ